MTRLIDNSDKLNIGDVVFYIDADNSQKWEVTDLFYGGFTAQNEFGEEDSFIFSELQFGWYISNKSVEYNEQNYKTKYIKETEYK